MKYEKLFSPITIGKLTLKNRTSMAPMGPIGYADSNGGFNQRLQDYYVERAKNNVGLIITGICSVDTEIEGLPTVAIPCPTTVPIAFIHSTRTMNERIHAYGSKILLQLTGGLGRSAIPGFTKNNIAPSAQGNRFVPSIEHREMTREEILNLIQKFIASAAVAKKAGFDGVEVHAVHEGYLLDQFAISIYNHRDDEFGGCLENRLRVATEIVKGIKKVCGEDFTVSLRYSLKSCMKGLRQGGLPGEDYEEAGRDVEEGIEAAKILVDAGYDMLNVDAGTYDSWYWNHPPMYFGKGVYNEYAKILKQHVNVPIILAGRMDDPQMANDVIDECCDIVSYGRPLLADAEYVTKVRYNREDEIRPCLGCHEGCLGRIANGPISCAVNPACGREEIYGLTPALIKKNILIIGGGVAGMETARVAALRGHNVTLVEKSDKLGGNLIPGGAPDFKHYDYELIHYYERQMELLHVDVRMNTTVTAENVADYHADEVVVATGSNPIQLNFGDKKQAVLAEDVLLKKVEAGQKVVIVGAGLVGCETGLWLAQQGKDVTIVEAAPVILGGPGHLPHMNEFMLEDLLHFHKVEILTSAKVTGTTENGVLLGDKEIACDTLITCVGYRANNSLYNELSELDTPVHNIGDSNKVANIMFAIWDAYELARGL